GGAGVVSAGAGLVDGVYGGSSAGIIARCAAGRKGLLRPALTTPRTGSPAPAWRRSVPHGSAAPPAGGPGRGRRGRPASAPGQEIRFWLSMGALGRPRLLSSFPHKCTSTEPVPLGHMGPSPLPSSAGTRSGGKGPTPSVPEPQEGVP